MKLLKQCGGENSVLEKHFENVLHRYPELIEEGLKFSGRQVNVGGKFVDLLFEDRYGQKLIVELKKGIIKREHVAQLLDYEGYFLSADNLNIRVMLIGNRVPPNLRNSLDHHGFEWREITISVLITHLKNNNDDDLLSLFDEQEKQTVNSFEQAPTSDKSIINKSDDIRVQSSARQAKSSLPSSTLTETQLIDTLPVDLQRVYLEMRTRAMAFSSHVDTYIRPNNYFIFKFRNIFAEIQYQRTKSCFHVGIRPEGFSIPENKSAQVHGLTVTRVADTNGWPLNYFFDVDCNSSIDEVEKLLRQSFNAVLEKHRKCKNITNHPPEELAYISEIKSNSRHIKEVTNTLFRQNDNSIDGAEAYYQLAGKNWTDDITIRKAIVYFSCDSNNVVVIPEIIVNKYIFEPLFQKTINGYFLREEFKSFGVENDRISLQFRIQQDRLHVSLIPPSRSQQQKHIPLISLPKCYWPKIVFGENDPVSCLIDNISNICQNISDGKGIMSQRETEPDGTQAK